MKFVNSEIKKKYDAKISELKDLGPAERLNAEKAMFKELSDKFKEID